MGYNKGVSKRHRIAVKQLVGKGMARPRVLSGYRAWITPYRGLLRDAREAQDSKLLVYGCYAS
jgi:hypothetical protein